VQTPENVIRLGVMLNYCTLEVFSKDVQYLCLLGGGCYGFIKQFADFTPWSPVCRCKESYYIMVNKVLQCSKFMLHVFVCQPISLVV